MQLYSKILKGVQLKEKELFEVDNSIFFCREEHRPLTGSNGCGLTGQQEDFLEQASEEQKIIQEAEKKSAQMVQEAREQAEIIVREAKEQAESILLESREKGYEEGALKGREEGERICREAREFLGEVSRFRQEIIESLEQDMVELSITIAQSIMKYQLSVNRETVVDMVSTAMKKLNEQSYILIRVHPREADIVKKNRDRLQLLLTDRAQLEILGDCEIPWGSCRVEGEHGLVEINLQENLKEVQEVLKEVVKSVDHSENQP